MAVMGIKVIRSANKDNFELEVKKFLEKYEELVLHDKTVFGITCGQKISAFKTPLTYYSAIFYGELG